VRVLAWGAVTLLTAAFVAAAAGWVGGHGDEPVPAPSAPVASWSGDVVFNAPAAQPPPPGGAEGGYGNGQGAGSTTVPTSNPDLGPSAVPGPGGGPSTGGSGPE
jgi:hypothetical protein